MDTYRKIGDSLLVVTVDQPDEDTVARVRELAAKIGCSDFLIHPTGYRVELLSEIVAKAVAEEREAIAKLVDETEADCRCGGLDGWALSARIRARKDGLK